MLSSLVTSAALAMAQTAPAPAAETGGAARVVDQITACRAITDPGQRLACFDGAAAALAQASENREIVVLDREEVRKTERSLFGFSLPRLPFFGSDRDGDGEEEREQRIDEVESTIASVASAGYGKWVIALADGSTWQTTEVDHSLRPQRGDPVRIKRAALGSFLASIDGERMVRIRRTG